jgi:hypothetical protein
VIASVTYAGAGHVGRGTVVGGIAELSARTGRPLRTLLAEHAAPPDPGHPGWSITPCALIAADATGHHLLVSCDTFGRLDHARFTALPGAARRRRSRPPGDEPSGSRSIRAQCVRN